MNRRICFLISVLLILAASILTAQVDISTRNLYLEDGLSQSTVICIFQDSKGFIWLGTQNGLNRYDGSNFTIFRHDPADPASLSFSEIYGIVEDEEGYLWVGTANGLNRMDPRTGKCIRFLNDPDDRNSLSANFITSMARDSEGNIWLATLGGIDRLDPHTQRFTRYLVGESASMDLRHRIASLHIDSRGTLWGGARNNILYRYDSQSDGFEAFMNPQTPPVDLPEIPQLHRFSIAEESPGVLLIGAGYYGVFRFTEANGSFEALEPSLNALTSANNILITGILPLGNGETWICTYGGGVFRLRAGMAPERFHTGNQEAFGISSNHYITLVQDRGGLIWLASIDHGAYIVRPDKFTRYIATEVMKSGLSAKVAMSVFTDSADNIWIGHFDSLDRIDGTTGERTTYTEFKSRRGPVTISNIMLVRELDPGHLLMSGYPLGLVKVDVRTMEAEHLISTPLVFAFSVLSPDRIWLAALQEGIYRVDATTNTNTLYRIDASSGIDFAGKFFMFALEHDDHRVWVATNDGLYLYDYVNNRARSFLSSDEGADAGAIVSRDLNHIAPATGGGLWVGTGDGLYLVREGLAPRTWTVNEGLPSNIAYSCLEDGRGSLWIGTSKGLARMDIRSGDITAVFEQADGLPSQEFNQAAAYRHMDGRLYFGTMEGIAVCDPESVATSSYDPPVIIAGLQAGGTEESLLAEMIQLPWERHDVIFTFSGLDYAVPERVRYRYQLEGYDTDWIEGANINFARYTNLPAGMFTFRVKASNGDGVFGNSVASLGFEVLPPWWQTWWFRGVVILAAIAALFAIAAIWTGNANRQRDRLQAEVQARTAEIQEQRDQLADANRELETFNYSVSHDLRSPLNIIQQLGEILEQDYGPQMDEQGRKLVASIRQSAGRMNDLINSLLNLSKATRAPLNRMEADIGFIAREVAASLGRRDPDRQVDWQIADGLRARIDESLMRIALTNLLENAWKYSSNARQARIEFGAHDDPQRGRVYFVRDDGIGFDQADADKLFTPFVRLHGAAEFPGTGIGLTTVQRVIRRHGGEIWAEGVPGKGATMMFTLGE